MERKELSERLSADYAMRAISLGKQYKESYNEYFNRCTNRTTDDLLSQFKAGGLDKPVFG